MQYSIIRLAIKSHFCDCVIWVTNICKYLYILCNSWPQILIHQSKKVFLMLPTLFWTWNFMMTAASQNSPWIKFITHFVMCDFLNSKPVEQQQIKVSVYTAWIKINHMLKPIFFWRWKGIWSQGLLTLQNSPALPHICEYQGKHLKQHFPVMPACLDLKKKKKNLAAILLLPTSVVTHEKDNSIAGCSSQELIQSQTVSFNI